MFAATMALVVVRPRGIHEAVWTTTGAAVLVATRTVRTAEVAELLATARPSLAFLLALLLLSALLEAAGFFEWAALRAAELSRGNARALYRNVFLLGTAITTVLSLDTTAVILTPVVLTFVARLKLPPAPYVLACALVANVGSLTLPVSNLTNLLLAQAFGISAARFAQAMIAPQLAALAATYFVCVRVFRADLAAPFDVHALQPALGAASHKGYFRAASFSLAVVCAGYFVAPLARIEPSVPAFAVGALLLLVGLWAGRVRPLSLLSAMNLAIFPFIVGLFVVVRAVVDLGVGKACVDALGAVQRTPGLSWLAIPAVGFAFALASNAVNNLPAALLAESVLQRAHASPALVFSALLGTNVGPNVAIFGSLATMLVVSRARERGIVLSAGAFARIGAITTPLALGAALAALAGVTTLGVGR